MLFVSLAYRIFIENLTILNYKMFDISLFDIKTCSCGNDFDFLNRADKDPITLKYFCASCNKTYEFYCYTYDLDDIGYKIYRTTLLKNNIIYDFYTQDKLMIDLYISDMDRKTLYQYKEIDFTAEDEALEFLKSLNPNNLTKLLLLL